MHKITIDGMPLFIPRPEAEESARYLYEEVFKARPYESEYCRIRRNDFVLDAGANVGLFTLYALLEKDASLVLAIEPDEANRECLKANLKLHQVNRRCRVVPAALWHMDTYLPFERCPAHNGSSFVDGRGTEESRQYATEEYKVPGLRLDRIAEGYSHFNFIKLDIEGSEVDALIGGPGSIVGNCMDIAVAVYHHPEDPAAVSRILNAYQKWPYQEVKQSSFGHNEAIALFSNRRDA